MQKSEEKLETGLQRPKPLLGGPKSKLPHQIMNKSILNLANEAAFVRKLFETFSDSRLFSNCNHVTSFDIPFTFIFVTVLFTTFCVAL